MTPADVLLLGALSAIWGGSFIFMRYLTPLIGPVATADFRMLLAGIVLAAAFGVALDANTGLAVAGCLLAPACYDLSGVYLSKRTAGVPSLAIAGGSQLFGGLALLPFLAAWSPGPAPLDLRIVLVVAAFALLCNALAYLISYRLMATVGPTRALTVTFPVPVFSMAWGWLFLREPVTWGMAGGAAVILTGTWLVAGGTR